MSGIHPPRVEETDAQLIAAVRGGDTAAFGRLFDRHRDAAARLASHLVPGPDADDLVAESFTRVLALLEAGKGPDEFFRAYLLTSIRRLHVDRARRIMRVRATDDDAELDRTVAFVDLAEMRFEQAAAAAAFASLPERWQLVLWHLDVEAQRPADIASLLGMSPNSVSALAYRAREGLRQAYLQHHLAPSRHVSCRTTTGMLGSYVRKGLSARDTARVEAHLDECSRCTGLQLELAEINANLSGVLAPALLGAAATGYVATGAATVTGIGLLVEAALTPVKAAGTAVAGAGAQGVATAAVVATVATAGTVAVTQHDRDRAAADEPRVSAPRSSTPVPVPTDPSDPAPTVTRPAPTPQPTPTPTATPAPPEAVQPIGLHPTPETVVEPDVAAEPEVSDVLDAATPTDYAIGPVLLTNDLELLQRRLTIHVSAANPGRAEAEPVTLTLVFRRPVLFRGVDTPGWDCGGAVVDQWIRTLACTATLPAGEGATFVAKVRNLVHSSGNVTVTAPGDPVPGNDSAAFRAGLWPLS